MKLKFTWQQACAQELMHIFMSQCGTDSPGRFPCSACIAWVLYSKSMEVKEEYRNFFMLYCNFLRHIRILAMALALPHTFHGGAD